MSAFRCLSAKGIKAALGVQIDGGVFTIDSADDAIHSSNSITVNGGVLTVTTGDDGLHADKTLWTQVNEHSKAV